MLNVAGAAVFLGMLAVLAAVHLTRGSPRAVQALVGYCVLASSGAGFLQRDLWPFARWPMAASMATPTGATTRLLALDAAGGEHAIDARAFAPLGADELIPWMHRTFPGLPAGARGEVCRHLLATVEAARARAQAGTPPGTRRLGPFTAPSFDLHPAPWAAGAPAAPFAGLRVYREDWVMEERLRDRGRVRRTLVQECRP